MGGGKPGNAEGGKAAAAAADEAAPLLPTAPATADGCMEAEEGACRPGPGGGGRPRSAAARACCCCRRCMIAVVEI